jgi:effector-binding domain-containing protein
MAFSVTEPKLDTRPEQHYMGIHAEVSQGEMGSGIIPKLIGEVYEWLGKNGIEPDGPVFMRFNIINMPGKLDVEIGVPVKSPVKGDDRVRPGMLPAGRYASLVYTDVTKGIEGNSVLIGWAKDKGIEWDAWDDPKGHAFRSRYEIYIDGPEEDPDPTNWRTEVAIKVADGQS